MKFTPDSTSKIKGLIAVLEPYAPVWQEWTESGACTLNEKEIRILQNYLVSGSHLPSCKEFNMSELNAADTLDQIQLRLHWGSRKFKAWLTERMLEEQGIITYKSPVDRFLNSPLQFLPISYDLKIRLRYLMKYTMAEILTHYTENKLRAHWSADEKLICDLKEVLYQNNCLHLLR